MKLNKKIIPYVFVIIAFLISSCDYYTTGTVDIVTGTRGLVVELIRSSMPPSIFEGDNLHMQVRLRNEGALDIENGILYVSVDSQSFSVLNREEFESINLRGDDGIYRGEESVHRVSLESKRFLAEGITAHDARISINACYEYGTFFQDTFCIDTDVSQQQTDKPCRMSSLSGSRGQGAPVVVSRIEPRMTLGSTGAQLSFDVHIRNSGSGTVITSGSSERVCKGEFGMTDMNIVKLSEIKLSRFSLSEGDFICDSHTDNSNEFDLSASRDFVTCRLRDELEFSEGTFSTPITIELEYGYLQSINTNIKVERAR